MQYKKFGKLDYDASILGLGCMRFPTLDNKHIDEPEAIKLIRTAIDNGVNYIDTAYPYHQGKSEGLVGKALKDGYRNKIKLATKAPTFIFKDAQAFDQTLNEQLKRLEVDCIDFYLMHALNGNSWDDVVLKFDLMTKAEKAVKAGKIKHIGFSFHDEYEAFEKIMNGYDKWEFCQIQLNYLNEGFQAGLKGLKLASERGLPVIAMEPLLGGKLATPAKVVEDIFKSENKDRTPVEWALDYLFNMPEVTLVLSGMSTIEQLNDNIKYASRAKANMLTESELKTIKLAQEKFAEIQAVPCTECEYCLPCPNGISIPRNFQVYNDFHMIQDVQKVKSDYANSIGKGKTAESCTSCGVCETKCPQNIKISEIMPKVHETLK